MGLKPHYLTDDVLAQMMEAVLKHKANLNTEAIFRGVKWELFAVLGLRISPTTL